MTTPTPPAEATKPFRNFWSADETQRVLAMIDAGQSVAAIAEAIGRPVPGIYTKVSKLRLSGRADYHYPSGCAVPGCTGRHAARGLCKKHYCKAWRLRREAGR